MINTYKNNNKNLYRESFNINVDSESRAPPQVGEQKNANENRGNFKKEKICIDRFVQIFIYDWKTVST